jgi:hypothetical protein
MKKSFNLVVLLGCLLFMPVTPTRAQAKDVVVGVNLTNAPYDLSVAEQEAILGAMQKAGVRVIRAAIPGEKALPAGKGLSFVERVYARGIKILWLMGIHYAGAWPGPPPKGFAGLWGAPRMTQSDAERFRGDFTWTLTKLEEKGIALAGIELSNEINWAGFNADFPLPGQGRCFQLSDLTSDPEAQQVAKGLLLYVDSLAVMKDVRDHSKLNQHTPIITAGLADIDSPTHHHTWVKADCVGSDATLDFWRAHGLDKLVDGYGLHFYPSQKTAAERLAHLEQNGLEQCQPPGSARGKPCWITEWGFNVVGDKCPVDDSARTPLVRELRGNLSQLAKQNRLGGLFYYNWVGNIRAPKEDPASAFRCGALTESGRLAIDPM